MTSTELDTARQAEIDALTQAQDEEFSDTAIQVPILKLTQGLTKEVKEGDVEAGEFFNTLTSESYGNKVEVIIADVQRGRAASEKGGRYYVAIAQDTIPESWKDKVGEEFVGTPFAEYPDAEEIYKKRVNAGEIEWGSGPEISTTYNYTCLVVPSAPVDSDDEETTLMPVRIAFLRSTKKAHDKIQTLKKAALRGKPFWSVTFDLEAVPKSFGRNDAFVVNVKKGRKTTPEEQQEAIDLALNSRAGRVSANDVAEDDAAPTGPAETPAGAVAV